MKAKAKENRGLRIADSQSSHLLSELDINDRGCFGFRNFSRQRCPLVIAGGVHKTEQRRLEGRFNPDSTAIRGRQVDGAGCPASTP